jgi:hypothetical protein
MEECTTMALLNVSPQATDLLPSGERYSMHRAHNKRAKWQLPFLYIHVNNYFLIFLLLSVFIPPNHKHSFKWSKEKIMLKYEKCTQTRNEIKGKEMKWLAFLPSFVLNFITAFSLFLGNITSLNLLRTMLQAILKYFNMVKN